MPLLTIKKGDLTSPEMLRYVFGYTTEKQVLSLFRGGTYAQEYLRKVKSKTKASDLQFSEMEMCPQSETMLEYKIRAYCGKALPKPVTSSSPTLVSSFCTAFIFPKGIFVSDQEIRLVQSKSEFVKRMKKISSQYAKFFYTAYPHYLYVPFYCHYSGGSGRLCLNGSQGQLIQNAYNYAIEKAGFKIDFSSPAELIKNDANKFLTWRQYYRQFKRVFYTRLNDLVINCVGDVGYTGLMDCPPFLMSAAQISHYVDRIQKKNPDLKPVHWKSREPEDVYDEDNEDEGDE